MREHAGVADLTGLDARVKAWKVALTVRRVIPSGRQKATLTALEKKVGWKYSIIASNFGPA